MGAFDVFWKLITRPMPVERDFTAEARACFPETTFPDDPMTTLLDNVAMAIEEHDWPELNSDKAARAALTVVARWLRDNEEARDIVGSAQRERLASHLENECK